MCWWILMMQNITHPLLPSLILSRSIKAFHWRWPPKHFIQCPAMHCSRSESRAFLPLTRTSWHILVYFLTSLCLTPRCLFSSFYLLCRVPFTHTFPYTTFFLPGCHLPCLPKIQSWYHLGLIQYKDLFVRHKQGCEIKKYIVVSWYQHLNSLYQY